MNIVFLAAECAPYVKVGGLADVVGALPQVLHRLGGHSLRVILPHYGVVDDARYGIQLIDSFDMDWNQATTRVEVSSINRDGVDIYFLRGWPFFEQDEDFVYSFDEGINIGRYLFFCAAALMWLRRHAESTGLSIDLLHIHDWHTAFAAYLLAQVYNQDERLGWTATLFSIHNMMYQGWGVGWHIDRAGLPPVDSPLLYAMGKADNALAIGIAMSTMLGTVSPTYAKEMTTVEEGYGLDGLLHARLSRMLGILNGIDVQRWNPETSRALAAPFGIMTLDERIKNKTALQAELGLPVDEGIPLIGSVTRLVEQKGIDILIPAMRQIFSTRQAQLVFLGSGMPHYEAQLAHLAASYPDRVALRTNFDEPLSERIYAGSDLFLMPSLFEPCGIGQMLAMHYGSLPVVRAVGGLADTVDSTTGFLFGPYEVWALTSALNRALDTYESGPSLWREMQVHAMSRDFAWESSAHRYLELYRLAIEVYRSYAQ